jgi:amidase
MNLETMTILELQDALQAKQITSEQLVLHYLKRIATIDQGETPYNSVYMINPDAIYIAKMLDKERQDGLVRSVMHGIPILLKDNINTGDKQTTTAGANILKHHRAIRDAKIVETLREQGAIILGKTNLTELACFKSFKTVNGFSSLAGYVLCPWNIEEDPSGSSTGSAVSVSLRLAPVAIGTETGGSIMSPSMKNGVVGLKPTIGFVSRSGNVPISSTLDTAGPMGNRVADVAALLSVLPDYDPSDPVTLTRPDEDKDYTKYLSTSLNGKRIGIDKTHYDSLSKQRQAAFDNVCKTMESLGATIVDDLNIQQTKRIYLVMKYEFKNMINHYFAEEGLDITLRDLVRYNEQDPKANLKYGQEVLLDSLHHASGLMNESDYIKALEEKEDAKSALEEIFHKNKLDMIYFAGYTSLGPHCGFPTLSLPVGFDEDNMPIGTYFLAPYWHEHTLIEVASAIEDSLQLTFNPLKNTV